MSLSLSSSYVVFGLWYLCGTRRDRGDNANKDDETHGRGGDVYYDDNGDAYDDAGVYNIM